ncbi:6196_t:CDS:2 [Ambispora gerdemannii]|uniref:6196_t:CDS:1 n=1 Tax=Ambispora gerdemannii TaxID=144530 RepID=A0A9N9AB57_9GLOM|nr:6196_t:CDS:2 [Ambispora gerdemannii]
MKEILQNVMVTNEKKENCPNCHEKWNIYCQFCPTCELPPWSSNNNKIDKIIKESQVEIYRFSAFLEWIAYEEFSEIELIDEGGFGSVSKAIWNSGYIIDFNKKQRKLVRAGPSLVALKTLFKSSDANLDIIQEILGEWDYRALRNEFEENIENRKVEKASEIHKGAVYKSRSISKIIEAAGVDDITSINSLYKLPDGIYCFLNCLLILHSGVCIIFKIGLFRVKLLVLYTDDEIADTDMC